MKKFFLFTILTISTFLIFSQKQELSENFKKRELNAPTEVKNELLKIRQDITAKNLNYLVSFTSKSALPIEKITGERELTQAQATQLLQRIKNNQLKLQTKIKQNPYLMLNSKDEGTETDGDSPYIYGNPTQSYLDLRTAGLVSPVRDQGAWGTCWAFGAMACYEGSYRVVNNTFINASEQYVINCSGAGTPSGGLAFEVLDWMVDNHKNISAETSLPYAGASGTCPGATPPTDYYAVNWGIVHPSGNTELIPTVAQIKDAICRYGVISASVKATTNFKYYAGGVFYEFPSASPYGTNHAIAIIGWNDAFQSWLIKNSWGNEWGSNCGYGTDEGYMWIKYNSNNIGKRAAWVKAQKKFEYRFKAGAKWHDFFCIGSEIPKTGDVNGDGKDDIITFTRGTDADVYVALSDGQKFNGRGLKWHDRFCVGNEIPLAGDFNGDGKCDIVTFTRGNTGDVYVALSNGSSFQGTSVKWHDNFCIGTEIPLVGDFNGDGKDDIATFSRGSNADVFVALSNGSSFIGTAVKWHDSFCYGNEIPLTGDFNGDKKCDIATFNRGTKGDVFVALSNGSSFIGSGLKWHDSFCYGTEIPVAADFSGDKKCDLLTFLLNTTGDVYGAISNGAKFIGTAYKVHDYFGLAGEIPLAGDFNGDGKADLVTFIRDSKSEPGRGDVYVGLAR